MNEYSHDIGYLNDGDLKTTWISCISMNPISLVLDLVNGVYLLERVEIYFSSLPPTNLTLERYFNGKWFVFQSYSTNCTKADSTCSQLPGYA